MKTERKLNTEWTTPYLRICRCRRPSCGSPYRRWPATSSRSSTIWPIPSFVGQTGDDFRWRPSRLTSPVFMALTALGILFGIGGGSFISRQLGERKPENACKASALCFWGQSGAGRPVSRRRDCCSCRSSLRCSAPRQKPTRSRSTICGSSCSARPQSCFPTRSDSSSARRARPNVRCSE